MFLKVMFKTGLLLTVLAELGGWEYLQRDSAWLHRASRGIKLQPFRGRVIAVMSVIPGALTAHEVNRNSESMSRPIPTDLWKKLKEKGLLHPDAPAPVHSTQ
jgi:hypothetical protein